MDRNHQGVNRGSSQIWGPYLAVKKQGGSMEELYYYVKNTRVSPYIELQADSLYENDGFEKGFPHIDVNPYLRFFSIFDPFLTPDDLGYEEFQEAFADILLHYLADLDLKADMCRHDFYLKFIVRDMEDGVFGGLAELAEFTDAEKLETAWHILSFYQTGDAAFCLKRAVESLQPECKIYIREGQEFVFYMRQPWNEKDERRLNYLIRLFLPLSYSCTVHWMRTYGITGYEETMRTGDFILA